VTDPRFHITRRRLLGAAAGLVAATALPGPLLAREATSPATARIPRLAGTRPRHLAWVWQFRHDGDPAAIRDNLAAHGLGVVLKTHDGAEWMSRYDPTDHAVSGPKIVEQFARFFEDGGVPFHAWAVVKGARVEREAQLASEVLDAGARSLFLDLEAHAGFWVGTGDDAAEYGERLRALQPSARLSTSIDPRPWEIDRIPLAEFAAFTDEISPQVYWGMFGSKANLVKYALAGEIPDEAGVTPTFVLASAMRKLEAFGLPVHPIGDGTVLRDPAWPEFLEQSYGARADAVSVWRYGVAEPAIWEFLRDNPPRAGFEIYVVQPGDSLGRIAARYGTTVDEVAAENDITNPNLIHVGMELRVPSTGGATPSGTTSTPPAATSGGTYTVQAGDTLGHIAERLGVSTARLQAANGLSNPNALHIGQVLIIP
jgi:LysM repeat protein